MSPRRSATKPNYTAAVIQRLAAANNVAVVVTSNDVFAQHVTRLSGNDVNFDPIENTIVALQRAGFWTVFGRAPSGALPARKPSVTLTHLGISRRAAICATLQRPKIPKSFSASCTILS